MEYCPGIKINRIQALDELGVDRKRYDTNKNNPSGLPFSLKNVNQIPIYLFDPGAAYCSLGWDAMLLNLTWSRYCLMVFSMLIQ